MNCVERVRNSPRSFTTHPCGRVATVGDLCRVHAAARKRIDANAAKRANEDERRFRAHLEVTQRARQFTADLGVTVEIARSAIGFNGKFQIAGDDLDKIVERLAARPAATRQEEIL